MNDYILYWDFNKISDIKYFLKVKENLFVRFSMNCCKITLLHYIVQDWIYNDNNNYTVIKLEDNFINLILSTIENNDNLSTNLIFEIFKIKLNEIT